MTIGFKHALLAAAAAVMIAGTSVRAQAPVVEVSQGRLEGTKVGRAVSFLGIPYAAAPVGELRWRSPQPAAPWNGVRKAVAFGPSCLQDVKPEGFGPWTSEYVVQGNVDEDCLYLNVWAPASRHKGLPVMVWIHGGGFSSGSGSVAIYDGSHLAARGMIVVTINYRLGVFGFFSHPELTEEAHGSAPGNWGLQDQVAALNWVRENIGKFGGDPDKVTLAGQSAGSWSVQLLLLSPSANGLYRSAISESGLLSTLAPASLSTAEAAGTEFQTSVGASSLQDLRAMPANEILAKAVHNSSFRPIVDGVLLADSPRALLADGKINHVPVLIGQVANEISSFYGRESLDVDDFEKELNESFGSHSKDFVSFYPAKTDADRLSAAWMIRQDVGKAALYEWATQYTSTGNAPVYMYYYNHSVPGPDRDKWKSFHTSEVPYVFQTLGASPQRPFTAIDRTISNDVSTRWINFVRTGDPNNASLKGWKTFDPASPGTMMLGDKVGFEPLLPASKLNAVKAFIAEGGNPKLFEY